MIRNTLIYAGAALLVGLSSAAAEAATSPARSHQNAAGICQAALPVFEGNIRKRPTAVANEGTATAFVSCSMQTSSEVSTGISEVNLVLYNRNAVDTDVTCSLVHSFQSGGTVVPKTQTIPGGGARSFFKWVLSDIGNPATFSFANFSCGLPVGVEIGYGFYPYTYEIGT